MGAKKVKKRGLHEVGRPDAVSKRRRLYGLFERKKMGITAGSFVLTYAILSLNRTIANFF